MIRKKRYTVAVLLLLSGCQAVKPQLEESVYVRGILKETDQGIEYRSCRSDQWLPVAQLSDIISDEYHQHFSEAFGAPLYIEGWRAAADSGPAEQVTFMDTDLRGCHLQLDGIKVQVDTQNSEGWQFTLTDQNALLNLYGQRRTYLFPPAQASVMSNVKTWQTQLELRGRTLPLEVRTYPRGCRMANGAWSAYFTELNLNGKQYLGCARLGEIGMLRLAQSYSTPSSEYLRSLRMVLGPNHSVSLAEDYRNGQPVTRWIGSWHWLDEQLILRLTQPNNAIAAQTLLWQLEPTGDLKLVSDSERYGEGLTLQPSTIGLQWSHDQRTLLPMP